MIGGQTASWLNDRLDPEDWQIVETWTPEQRAQLRRLLEPVEWHIDAGDTKSIDRILLDFGQRNGLLSGQDCNRIVARHAPPSGKQPGRVVELTLGERRFREMVRQLKS